MHFKPHLLALGFAVLSFLLPAATHAAEYVLGTSAAFTGPSRGLGIELYRGSAAYISMLNQNGGVGGTPVRILYMDDGYNPAPAVDNSLELLSRPEVVCLFNYVGTPTVTRILPLLKSDKNSGKQLFFPFTGAQPLRRPPYDKHVFNLRASYQQELKGIIDKLHSLGLKRFAVFYQADAYGRSGWDGVRRALAPYGLDIAGECTYHRGADDTASMMEQAEILMRTNPDALISVGSYQACAVFIRDARNSGLQVPIINLSFVGSESLLKRLLAMSLEYDRDYTRGLINTQVVPSYEDTSLPGVREYRDAMAKYAPRNPQGYSADFEPFQYSFVSFEGYLNAKLMARILEQHMLHPQQSLGQAAEQLGEVDLGIGTPVIFGPDRHQGLDKVYFTTVRDGKFYPMTNEDWERLRK